MVVLSYKGHMSGLNQCQKNRMRCCLPTVNLEPYTTSAGLYSPVFKISIPFQQVIAGCLGYTCVVYRTLSLVYIVLYIFEKVYCFDISHTNPVCDQLNTFTLITAWQYNSLCQCNMVS